MSETTDRAAIVAAIATNQSALTAAQSTLATAISTEAAAQSSWITAKDGLVTAKQSVATLTKMLESNAEGIYAMPHGKVLADAIAKTRGIVSTLEPWKNVTNFVSKHTAATNALNSLTALLSAEITPDQVVSQAGALLATAQAQVSGYIWPAAPTDYPTRTI